MKNAHAPDEYIALENYFGGIKAIAHSDLATLEPSSRVFRRMRSRRLFSSGRIARQFNP